MRSGACCTLMGGGKRGFWRQGGCHGTSAGTPGNGWCSVMQAQEDQEDLSEQLTTFSAGFRIDLTCGKPAGKVSNNDYVTTGHKHRWNCELVAKRQPSHDCWGIETVGAGCSHVLVSAITTSNSCSMNSQ